MAEPRVFDVRDGLTADVLEGLHEAQRISLAAKDQRTAALGFWVGDDLNVALIDSDPLLLQVRRAAQAELRPGEIRVFKPRPILPRLGLVCSTEHPATDAFWSRLLGVLREGDVIRLAEDFDKPGLLQVHVFAGGSRVASLRLPRRHQARSVA